MYGLGMAMRPIHILIPATLIEAGTRAAAEETERSGETRSFAWVVRESLRMWLAAREAQTDRPG